jgi:hypothetical protein
MTRTSKLSRLAKFTWLSAEEPNQAWDDMLNLLMDKGEVTEVTQYTITFNGKYRVWVENHPYASGSISKYCFDEMEKEDRHFSFPSNYHCTKKTKIRLEDFFYNLICKSLHSFNYFVRKCL